MVHLTSQHANPRGLTAGRILLTPPHAKHRREGYLGKRDDGPAR